MVTGTLINVVAVMVGGTLGMLVGAALPPRFREIVMQALGLATLLIGAQMALRTLNPLFPLLGILCGALLGEAMRIEDGLGHVGAFFQQRLAGDSGTFAEGFVTASLVFCVGPITVLGALQNGLTGDIRLLSVKSVLDGFASFGFAASLGPGVLLAALTILVYQGSISMGAGAVNNLLFAHLTHAQFLTMMAEMTSVGGLMVMAVGLRLLQLVELRIGNFLPGIVIAPVLALVAPLVGHIVHLP